MGLEEEPITFSQDKSCKNSYKWIEAVKDEIKSMEDNNVWDLVKLPQCSKLIGCKWIFKTKQDSNGNTKKYKACLIVKGFTQKENIDFKETFFTSFVERLL